MTIINITAECGPVVKTLKNRPRGHGALPGFVVDREPGSATVAATVHPLDSKGGDARRDWTALGGRHDDVIPLGKFRQGAEIPHAEGTVGLLISR